ncbi:FAD-dependent monooxygenase [Streptomyces sp. NPDC056697]|uniref:aromatic-ring hydroxylase C-terminal domain-containing protein n=1 Tax=Streptomyces sp. NPDC056697 TaxID=3345915 RepID=UPI0036C57809
MSEPATGLFLAGELALLGVRVTVLERLQEPDPTIKAGSINVASAEILDRCGLLPAAEDVQRRLLASVGAFADRKNAFANQPDSHERGSHERASRMRAAHPFPVAGHFAGMPFRNELVDQADPVLAGQDGRFVLVDRSPDGRFAQATRPLEQRIAYVVDPASDTSPPSLLIRPDGVIVWATSGDTTSSDDAVLKDLDTAIQRWVGTA